MQLYNDEPRRGPTTLFDKAINPPLPIEGFFDRIQYDPHNDHDYYDHVKPEQENE